MPTDPSIILGIQNNQPDLGAIYGNALKIRQEQLQTAQLQTEMQQQNALRQILSSPDAVDPTTGKISKNALIEATRIAPQEGFKLSSQNAQIDEREAQTAHIKSETYQQQQSAVSDAAAASLDIYENALKSNPPEVARKIAQDAYTEQRDKLAGSGLLPPEVLDRIPTNFDPLKVRQFLSATERDREERLAETKTRDEELAGYRSQSLAERKAEAEKRGGTIYHDTKTGVDFVMYPNAAGGPRAETLDGEPYQPQSAVKVASNSPRSAVAAGVQKFMEEHPNATSEDIAQYAGQFHETQTAQTAFGTGKQGQAVNSFNVGIAHLNTLDGLVKALGNGDVKTVNRLSQHIKEEFGGTAPTNFDAAKAIVGDEIIKAIVGGGGALADRENAQNQLDRAKTPQQLEGVIKTYKDLMAGQLKGLQKQYENTTRRKDFSDKLLPSTKSELGVGDSKRTSGPPPEVAAAMNKPNKVYHLTDGTTWRTDAQGHPHKVGG